MGGEMDGMDLDSRKRTDSLSLYVYCVGGSLMTIYLR